MRKGLVFGLALIMASAAAAQWSDNFDSYDSGSGIYGQGGWTCWDDNPAYDAYVTGVQFQSSPHSLMTISTSDVVQEFNITEGNWEISAWHYIPSTATGDQFFILLTYYEGASSDWALQLKFDNEIGQMMVTEGSGVVDIIDDQWVEVKVEIMLGANSQNIYYNGTFVETIPWSPTSGILEFDALDIFSDGGDPIYWDDIVVAEG
ncbi:MAG TPA: hypothetical protein P5207_00475, partial [Candidatus Sabulitectum sp.]|nr:hypothetical protein [Candidatus Sabulitectum sp.]